MAKLFILKFFGDKQTDKQTNRHTKRYMLLIYRRGCINKSFIFLWPLDARQVRFHKKISKSDTHTHTHKKKIASLEKGTESLTDYFDYSEELSSHEKLSV